jgi:hypothetical protein
LLLSKGDVVLERSAIVVEAIGVMTCGSSIELAC